MALESGKVQQNLSDYTTRFSRFNFGQRYSWLCKYCSIIKRRLLLFDAIQQMICCPHTISTSCFVS